MRSRAAMSAAKPGGVRPRAGTEPISGMVMEPPALDRVGVGEAFLAIDHDAQLVAGIEMIGRIVATGTGAA